MEELVKKFESRIAKRILRDTCIVTMGLCVVILSSFIMGLLYLRGRNEVHMDEVIGMLVTLIGVVCTCTVIQFVLLWYISRRAAKESVKPLVEAFEREKSFTSYASHELRTPLAIIKGSLEVLIRKPRREKEYVIKIKESLQVVDAMSTMVDNLLTLTRAKNNIKILQPTLLSVKDILTESCSKYADIMLRRKISVNINVVPESLKVNADRHALMTILNNVISNASKYCNEGGKIDLRARQHDGQVLIEVENSGPGIPSVEAKKVFEPFYRSINSGHQRIGGYGLGLAIVSSFAQMINAEVTLRSSEKGPTCVQLRLNTISVR